MSRATSPTSVHAPPPFLTSLPLSHTRPSRSTHTHNTCSHTDRPHTHTNGQRPRPQCASNKDPQQAVCGTSAATQNEGRDPSDSWATQRTRVRACPFQRRANWCETGRASSGLEWCPQQETAPLTVVAPFLVTVAHTHTQSQWHGLTTTVWHRSTPQKTLHSIGRQTPADPFEQLTHQSINSVHQWMTKAGPHPETHLLRLHKRLALICPDGGGCQLVAGCPQGVGKGNGRRRGAHVRLLLLIHALPSQQPPAHSNTFTHTLQ
jgi:hypothetical protein